MLKPQGRESLQSWGTSMRGTTNGCDTKKGNRVSASLTGEALSWELVFMSLMAYLGSGWASSFLNIFSREEQVSTTGDSWSMFLPKSA